jgi:thioredoxin reductase (NADPH)
MAEPILFVVEDDPGTIASLATALERRFGADYRILTDRSPSSALTRLEKARDGGEEVALVVADLWMPEMTGIELLARARDLFPRAARCVLAAFGDAAAYPLVRRALVLGQINTLRPRVSQRGVIHPLDGCRALSAETPVDIHLILDNYATPKTLDQTPANVER